MEIKSSLPMTYQSWPPQVDKDLSGNSSNLPDKSIQYGKTLTPIRPQPTDDVIDIYELSSGNANASNRQQEQNLSISETGSGKQISSSVQNRDQLKHQTYSSIGKSGGSLYNQSSEKGNIIDIWV